MSSQTKPPPGNPVRFKKSIEEWLAKPENRTAPEASFVYRAWLDATKDRALVEKSIEEWLAKPENRTAPEASFVYRAWLDATKDRALVEKPFGDWLRIDSNRTAHDADFVYRAWLEADGDLDLVREGLFNWLHAHRDQYDAVYVTKILAGQRDLPPDTIRDILYWCAKFASDTDAPWRLSQLRSNLLLYGVEQDVVFAAESVFEPRLSSSKILSQDERSLLCVIMSNLIRIARRERAMRQRVDTLLLAWMRHPGSYGDAPPLTVAVQRPEYVQEMVDLIDSGVLHPERDREPIERFLRWVNAWEPERKAPLHRTLTWLRYNHPAEGLWEIVNVPDPESTCDLSIQVDGSNQEVRAPHESPESSLVQLAQMPFEQRPWSRRWQDLWEVMPGDARLVRLGRDWLPDQMFRPDWPYVWIPLFEWEPNDSGLRRLALVWLEREGPRERGAWGWLWLWLWKRRISTPELRRLGLDWLDESADRERKLWWEVHAALTADGFDLDRLAELARRRSAALGD